jgi:hypothetical protein
MHLDEVVRTACVFSIGRRPISLHRATVSQRLRVVVTFNARDPFLAWNQNGDAIVDLVAFDAAANRALAGDRDALEEAAALYQGDVLPDCAGAVTRAAANGPLRCTSNSSARRC